MKNILLSFLLIILLLSNIFTLKKSFWEERDYMVIKAQSFNRNLIRSGVYVGGIGAGGFEIRPDGKFYRCQIFNDWKLEIPLKAFFIHRYRNKTRVLWLNDLITAARVIKGVEEIKYKGEFPKVILYYPEIDVKIEFLSFFIPGDVKNSSLPSIMFKIKGNGKMFFIFPPFSKSIPQFRKQKVILKSKEGEIGIYSSKGKVFYTPNFRKIMDVICSGGSIGNETTYYNIKDHFYFGVFWNGNFDDEIIISWYYPDMRDLKNRFIGHYYTKFFKSCNDVLNYVIKNKELLKAKTEKFYNNIYSKEAPKYLKISYSAQLSSFVKQSWLTKDGKFGVWEGSPCSCGLQTTDVAYYGSWLYVKLFPELEKAGIRLTAKFQKKDGWIPHFFPGTFDDIDEYRRKDMNMQFVLMVYRDYILWNNDKKFLKEMYPKVKKSMLKVYKWDKDGDKIPDIEGPDQTFDVWGWKGCSIYLASLWLGALRVGEEVGKIMNDKKFSKKCAEDFKIVKKNIIKKLWNGEYFILWTDGKEKDEGCLLDALSGDWYCYLLGLGHILPEKMIKSHLKTCLKYNRKKIDPKNMKAYYTPGEKGWCYINGGYKDNKRYCFQQYEPWTGMEYAFALHLYIMGMKKEALKVIKDVYNRKLKCGMIWNHIECGGDYFRPMVIGAFWNIFND